MSVEEGEKFFVSSKTGIEPTVEPITKGGVSPYGVSQYLLWYGDVIGATAVVVPVLIVGQAGTAAHNGEFRMMDGVDADIAPIAQLQKGGGAVGLPVTAGMMDNLEAEHVVAFEEGWFILFDPAFGHHLQKQSQTRHIVVHANRVAEGGVFVEGIGLLLGNEALAIDGEGVVRYADGSKFKGQFKKGLRNGKAIEQDKDGKRFEGSYVDDRRDGPFIEKDANGNITATGTYVRGRRQADK